MTLYADDLHLTKPIKDARDYISLQEDITVARLNELQVESYCYLGVIVNQHILWSEHIRHLCE